jgi:hypothetical protein
MTETPLTGPSQRASIQLANVTPSPREIVSYVRASFAGVYSDQQFYAPVNLETLTWEQMGAAPICDPMLGCFRAEIKRIAPPACDTVGEMLDRLAVKHVTQAHRLLCLDRRNEPFTGRLIASRLGEWFLVIRGAGL